MHMVPKLATRLLFISLVLEVSLPLKQVGGAYSFDNQVRRSSVMAIRNIYDTQDALKQELELLEEKEKGIQDRKAKVKMLEGSFRGIFPDGRRTQDQTRSYLKHLKSLDNGVVAASPVGGVVVEKKAGADLVKGLVLGGLAAAVGMVLGIVIGKGLSSRSRTIEYHDGYFASIVGRLKSNQ